MSKLFRVLAAILFTAVATSVVVADDAPQLESSKQKASYGIGYNIGNDLSSNGLNVDTAAFLAGFNDALSGGASRLNQQEIQAAFVAMQQELQKNLVARAAQNKKDGEAFLATNAKKPGVITLPSGLQYKVLTQGTGATPTARDMVKTHYRGRLLNGTEFDSSYSRNEPATLMVSGVIKGWTEALQLMKVGAKWELYVPSGLAYGAEGPGRGKIGPNETLVFEIELLGVEAPPAGQSPFPSLPGR